MYLSSFIAFVAFFTSIFATISALPTKIQARDTAELYIFANCKSNLTTPHTSYAAIFWYDPDFLPEYPEPQLTAIISNSSCVNFAGKTTTVVTPFRLTATIPVNATSADEGVMVSTDASASSFSGPMAIFRGSGKVFYEPVVGTYCFWEYYQQDHQTEV